MLRNVVRIKVNVVKVGYDFYICYLWLRRSFDYVWLDSCYVLWWSFIGGNFGGDLWIIKKLFCGWIYWGK